MPEAVPALAGLMRAVWPGWYGPGGEGDADADLRVRSRLEGVPFGVVATEDGRVLGGAALAGTSYGVEEGEGPWLEGLLVAPEARRRGAGSALVAACEAQAWRNGAQCVFATTVAARGLLLRRGWRPLRTLPGGHEVLIRIPE